MDHPERPVQAADEVESFIHVLISFAIAYVPHNCRDAATFDVDYCFCEKTDDGPVTSLLKRRCVTDGYLYTTRDGRQRLQFLAEDRGAVGQKRSRRSKEEHPLNHIFRVLLSWTKTRYAQSWDLTTGSRVVNVGSSKENIHEEYLVQRPGKLEASERMRVTPLLESQRLANGRVAPGQPSAEDKPVKSGTHDMMIDLLSDTLAKCVWPIMDKTPDQVDTNNNSQRADEADDVVDGEHETKRQKQTGEPSFSNVFTGQALCIVS